MAYSQEISRQNKALFMFLLDQSYSMAQRRKDSRTIWTSPSLVTVLTRRETQSSVRHCWGRLPVVKSFRSTTLLRILPAWKP